MYGCASVPNEPPAEFKSTKYPIGVVFLHAKWREPHSKMVAPLIEEMRSAGMWVVQPVLPWSPARNYDVDYETVMAEIHQEVITLRENGAVIVFVGGQSFGANAAIGYVARFNDADGILAIAPGHIPDINARGHLYGDSVERATQMVKEGKGSQTAEFLDYNQGKQAVIRMRADVYLSYFQPDGPAVIPLNISKMNKDTALFWVVGENDKIAWMGKHYAFNKAPQNPLSEYLETRGGHRKTPIIAKQEIMAWINKVVAAKTATVPR